LKAAQEEHTIESLADALIMTKLELAQQNMDYGELLMRCRDLEKKNIDLKVANQDMLDQIENQAIQINIFAKAQHEKEKQKIEIFPGISIYAHGSNSYSTV